MKIKILTIALFAINTFIFAQDRTTINATSTEISDNLDLRAVASIFGDSQNLEDFERRLNDPKLQISNLDLNNDNQVDYLRVIESVEGRTHLIIIQSVLERDVYQDIATVEVEKDSNNRVQVQVVGDVYMYGNNYIYEPVYVQTPVFYNTFWVTSYRPYCSSWNWNYYPTHFVAWNPFPIFRYRHNIGLCINVNYQYNYVNIRRNNIAYNNYYSRRCNGYEKIYPNRSFASRNSNHSNRYELEQSRPKSRDIAYSNSRYETSRRDYSNTSRNENTRNNSENTTRNDSNSDVKVRSNSGNTTRNDSNSDVKVRNNSGNTTRNVSNSDERVRSNNGNSSRNETSRSNSGNESRGETSRSNSGNTTRNDSNYNVKVRSNSGNTTRNDSNYNERVRSNNGNSSSNETSRSNSGKESRGETSRGNSGGRR